MSRFNNLEFGEHSDPESAMIPAIKDGAYYLDEAQGFFARGRFDQALRSYAKVLEHDPQSAAAWVGQVRMLIELGEHREANLWADKALEKFHDEPELLAAKAVALARTGDLKAAMVYSDNAVEAASDTPYVWLARGDVLLARKERRAEYCFDKALSFAPKDWMARWLICRIHCFYKHFSRAFKYAQEALELDAARAVLWWQFGQCQLALGLSGPAANSFQQAQQLDPQCHSAEEARSQLQNCGFWEQLRGSWRRLFTR